MKNRRLDKGLKKFELENMTVDGGSTITEIKKEIRAIADNYSEFADDVFEAGCTALALKYKKTHKSKKLLDVVGCFGLFITFFGIVIIPRGYQPLGLVLMLIGCAMSTVFTIKGVKNNEDS